MTTTRACVTCGRPFQVNPRTPRRRYCTPRCRAQDWRRRHNPASSSPNTVTAVNGIRRVDDVANDANPVRGANDVTNDDRRTALTRCPHCQTPIAVLTLLLPPAAAHVASPQAHHG